MWFYRCRLGLECQASWLPYVCFLALCLLGCGGSGGSGESASSGFVVAQVPIDWAQRARGIGGPESALSAVVTIKAAGTGQKDVTLEVDRATTPAAYSKTYPMPSQSSVGLHAVTVTFYAQAGGAGSVVGSETPELEVMGNGMLAKDDGTPLGSIQAVGTVASVQVTVASVTVGQVEAVSVSAFDANNDLVMVSPGSIFLAVTPGTGSASIKSDGELLGATAGSASVTATIDGIASPSVPFGINPAQLSAYSLAVPVNHLVYDTQTGHLWATETNVFAVLEIDPVARTVAHSIPLSASPTCLAISDDGSALYVGQQGVASVLKIDPVKRVVASTIPLSFGAGSQNLAATSIAIQPGNDDVIAVCQQVTTSSTYEGGVIYNNGTRETGSFGINLGGSLQFASSSVLLGSDYDDIVEGTVSANGVTTTHQFNNFGGPMTLAGGNIYLWGGQVVSQSTGELLGTLSDGSSPFPDFLATAYDPAESKAAQLISGYPTKTYLTLFDLSSYKELLTYTVNNSIVSKVDDICRWNGNNLAYTDGNSIYFLYSVPGL